MALTGSSLKPTVKRSFAFMTVLSLTILGLLLAGCGNGGGAKVSKQFVSGTAAAGAPMSGEVVIKDSSAPSQQRTGVIGDGSFAVDVTGMKAPFVLQATGTVNGVDCTLYSYADSTGIANINPLSNVIVAAAAGVDDPSAAFDSADSDKNNKIGANLSNTVTLLQSKLQPLLQQYNAENVHPITTPYLVNGLGLDGMFDNVTITITNGNLLIVNIKTGVTIFSGKVTDLDHCVFDVAGLSPTVPAPAAPTSLTAVGGTGQVTLNWASVGNAASYNVYFSTTSGVTKASETKKIAVSSPYTLTGLEAGTTYYCVVTSVNNAGEGAESIQASATTTAAEPLPVVPATPDGVSATGGTNQVSLKWDNVSNATSYNVYYSATSGVTKANGTVIHSATSPTVLPGLADSTTYYYMVTALNGSNEGEASVEVAATTLAALPGPTMPAAPATVSAVGGAEQATISWPAVPGADFYNVYWSTSAGVTKASGTLVSGVTSSYIKTGLSAGTTYHFIVTAANTVGESDASNEAVATTNAPPLAVPAVPTGVTAVGGAKQVSLTWSAVSGATSYNVYWATTSGVTTSGTKITCATNSYLQTGLATSTAYYYIVSAVNASGQGVASAQITATTDAPLLAVPAAPGTVTATGGANQVSLSWAGVSGATSYNLYYATTTGVTKTSGTKIAVDAIPYLQTGLVAGTTYYYIATAVNSAGEGAASAQASAATNAAVPVCGSCHAIPPALGQHSRHLKKGYGCDACHGAGYSSTTVNATTHNNKVINLTSTTGWDAAKRTCSNKCHSTESWD